MVFQKKFLRAKTRTNSRFPWEMKPCLSVSTSDFPAQEIWIFIPHSKLLLYILLIASQFLGFDTMVWLFEWHQSGVAQNSDKPDTTNASLTNGIKF